MSKLLVVTTGDFMLMTPGGLVWADRPSIVEPNHFIDGRVSAGQAKVLRNDLPDEADDEAFALFIKEHDGDVDAALENYLLKFSAEGAENAEVVEGGKAPAKGKGK